MLNLSSKQIDDIPKLIQRGVRNSEIASMFGCSVQTIQYWVKRWKGAGKKLNIPKGRPAKKLV